MKSGVSKFIQRYRWEVAIFLLALIVRLLYLAISIHAAGGDVLSAIGGSDGYLIVSRNLIEGHGLTQDLSPPYTPYSFRPPLYHFFIVGAYYLTGGFLGAILLQILIGSIVPLLGMALAKSIMENRTITLAVGIVLALEPSAILYSDMFYSETFFMLIFYGALWALFLYWKQRKFSLLALSALLLGLATLIRPAAEYVSLLVAFALWWQLRPHFSRRTLVAIASYLGIFLLVLVPWLYRNYLTFGVADLSPQVGVNLYTQLLPTVYSIDRGTPFQKEFDTILATGVRGPNLASVTDGGPEARTAIPLLLQHPKAIAISALNSLWSFFTMDGVFDFLRHIKIRPSETLGKPSAIALLSNPAAVASYFARNLWGPLAFILLGRILWITIAALFFVGTWRYLRTRGPDPRALLVLLVVFYVALSSCLTGYGLTARYRLPVNAFVVTFAIYGIATMSPRAPKQLHA